MLRSSDIPFSAIPAWHQPVGIWRSRGAGREALRVGLGLPLEAPKVPHPLDDAGFTLWHYWANSPQAAKTFPSLHCLLGAELLHRVAAQGEHPWHYLLLAGDRGALEQWMAFDGIPKEPAPTNSGFSFCHGLAWAGDMDIMRLLENESLASINSVDQQGLTPLAIAIHRGDLSFVQAFLMAGADPMVADPQGKTALHQAAQYGDEELMALLEDAGGESDCSDNHGLQAKDLMRARRQTPKDTRTIREHWARKRFLQLPF